MAFIFEVDSTGQKTKRVVYNWEDALGWIGGLLQILTLAQTILLKPFIKDAIVYKVAMLTKSGADIQIDDLSFFLKNTMQNMIFFKCCKKLDCIFNSEFNKRQKVFNYHKIKIGEYMKKLTREQYDYDEPLDVVLQKN